MKKDVFVLFMVLSVIGGITYFCISFYSLDAFRVAAMPILTILFIIITTMFLRKCFIWYASYMMTGKSNFQAKVDRPRVFLFSMLLPLLLIILFAINGFKGLPFRINGEINVVLDTLFFFSIVSLFAVAVLLLFKTLSKSFERLYLPKVQKIVRSYTTDFTSYASVDKLQRIFNGLINYDFLWYEDLNEQNDMRDQFVEIFITGNIPPEPSFQLKMDNLQTYILFENLAKETKDLSLTRFMKIVKNKNSKATADSITESYRKCVPENIKNRNLIEMIFSK